MTQVFIVSDIRLYREGLEQVLRKDGRLRVAGAAAGDEAAIDLERLRPDVALLDTSRLEALITVEALHRALPGIKVVVLGILERRRDILACAEAGIAGYVCRESSLDDLVKAVESAAMGELRCSPSIAAALLQRVSGLAAQVTDAEARPLTPRELEVLELLDEGLMNKEIAGRLHIGVATAKNHVHNILEKLQVHCRGEAASRARRSGLLPAAAR